MKAENIFNGIKDTKVRILQNLLLPSEYVRNNSSSPDVDIYVKSELWYL